MARSRAEVALTSELCAMVLLVPEKQRPDQKWGSPSSVHPCAEITCQSATCTCAYVGGSRSRDRHCHVRALLSQQHFYSCAYRERKLFKMADPGRLVKMEVDYSDTVERRLPEVQEMAKVRPCKPYRECKEVLTVMLQEIWALSHRGH